MPTDVRGVVAGHWTDEPGRTGCTVVIFPEGTVASGEVRGGAPGTREWALLAPRRRVDRIDAMVMSGGSAFGLATCDGVTRWCEEHGRGWPTIAGPVPIVVGAVIFDLGVGDPRARPGAAEGYAACEAASSGPLGTGAVGAGTGATVGKWRGPGETLRGGLGTATVTETLETGELVVSALVVVNAVGDVVHEGGGRARSPDPPHAWASMSPGGSPGPGQSTTLGLVVTNAVLDKVGCLLVAESAHAGLARALDPVHTLLDGDAVVGAATREVPAPVELVRLFAARATADAIRRAVPDTGAGDQGRAGAGSDGPAVR